ncbi:Hypothetical Protein FCC1311_006872 [Hondaea fermentalgiana]|uniref:Uncharacterized protein n=1 Tax=Hondaea fermentalgiana TaxID=2315210 RepID=A0A2R5G2C2_9STRA|nr:Hypothetical Protein FCC1311_006872 [Hondaea fermentalgiana]|eukprot:GBG24469.1 Hypothetical Protein FCC1311_006872 [Hondaea fermentalgiana]
MSAVAVAVVAVKVVIGVVVVVLPTLAASWASSSLATSASVAPATIPAPARAVAEELLDVKLSLEQATFPSSRPSRLSFDGGNDGRSELPILYSALQGARGPSRSQMLLLVCAIAAARLGFVSSCGVAWAFGSGCLLVAASTVIGFYGWYRVPRDVLHDLDGLETPGQRILEFFFHATWVSMTLFVLPTATVLLSSNVESACPEATGLALAQAGAYLSFVMILAAGFSMFYSLRIVTKYMILQSMQELCSLWTLLGAVLILTASLMMQNRVAFLSVSLDNSKDPSVWVGIAVAWSVIEIPIAIYGFAAGWVEGRHMLRIHGALSLGMILVALVFFVKLLDNTFGADIASTDAECASVLKLMGKEWFEDFFGCAKYLPTGDTDELNPPICERLATYPAPSKIHTTLTWETIVLNGTEAEACLIGCVDANCCTKVTAAIYTLKTMISGGGIWFLVVMIIGFAATLDLYNEIADDGKVLRHNRRGRIAITMGVLVCVALGVGLGTKLGGDFSIMQDASRAEACNYVLDANDTIDHDTTFSSCSNGIIDGDELEVDCGGDQCLACETDREILFSPTSSPSATPTEAITNSPTTPTMAPTQSPTVPKVSVRLQWNLSSACEDACDAPIDLDLKVRFAVDDSKICTVSSFADVNSACGGATHSGDATLSNGVTEEIIEMNAIAQTLYVFYVENRQLDRPIELAGAVLSASVDGILQDGDTFGNSSSSVTSCHPPDEDMQLVSNAEDCDDTDPNLGGAEACALAANPYQPGWYVDPHEMSSVARSCDDVCDTFELTCQTSEMATIVDEQSCLEKLSLAYQNWCSPQDLEYSGSGFDDPRFGGVLQMSAQNGRAHCACTGGILEGLYGDYSESTETSLGFDVDDVALEGRVFMVEAQRDEAFEDPGATCKDGNATLEVSGDSVDLTSLGTYVKTYSCCVNETCAERKRFITVDGEQDSCDDFLLEDMVVTDRATVGGGCLVYKKLTTSMNNAHSGFPFPDTFDYGSKNGIYAGACSKKPDRTYYRRVCYCG